MLSEFKSRTDNDTEYSEPIESGDGRGGRWEGKFSFFKMW